MLKGGNKYYSLILFIIFVIGFNLALPRQVFCYDTNIGHPGIADLAVRLYDKTNAKKISVEQMEWIKQGAIDEDSPTRWLNHFYDPVYNRGLWFVNQHESAKVWAKDPNEQQKYSVGDTSWQRAVQDYRAGRYETAFKELGHNVHLVSDMLVPAHTRDSVHAVPPDSYEQYVKKNWGGLSKDIQVQPIYKNSLEEVFDEAAKYSNGNYYSDNTIESSKYKINEINNYVPIIDGGDKKFIAQNFVDNELSGLYITDNFIWKSDSIKIVKQNDILSSYAHHLLPKAVAYSAGTIKLFMDETQKNQTEKLPFFKKNVGGLINSAVGQVINVATNIYSSYGASAGDNNATLNTQNNPIVDAASSIISYAATPPQAIQKITPNVIATEQTPVPSQTNITPIISPTNNQPSPVTPNLNTPIPSYSNPSYGGSISVPISDNQITSTTDNNTITTSSSTPVVSDTTSTTSTIDITTSTSSTVEIIPDSTPTSTEIAPTSTSNISSSTTSTVDTTTSTTSTVDIPTSTTSTVDVVTSTPPEPAPDVVINEIAWAGTSAFTPKDQYIELYNNTDQDILLFSKTDPKLSWKLLVGGKEIAFNKIINEVIPAHGFYLFETPDDRTVTDISADILHIGSFKSTGDDIKLVDNNGQLVDEVDASNGWFAGSDTNYTSMEKINPRTSGNKKENLQSNQGPRFTGGVDGGGDLILNGSPKQSNFGSIVLKLKQIETERTLKKSDYPYILGYYEIPVGKTLNIEPGVTIKTAYNNSKFEVKGTLNIQGAADNKVVVTSDTAAPKSWQGLMFYPGSVGNLSGLDMRFAGKLFFLDGSGQWGTPVSQAVRGDNATVTISDSVFSDNGDSTIYLKNSNATIQNSSFKNGQLAIENYDGNLTLKNITVENYSKDDGAIYVKNIWPQMSQLHLQNNTNNHVQLYQSHIASSTIVTADLPLIWLNVVIDSNAQVDVEAGTTIKLPPLADLFVNGTLNLNGTPNNLINIRTVKEANPVPVDYWGRIIFTGGKGNFQSANIVNGRGIRSTADNWRGMIVVNDSELTMENCQALDAVAPGNDLEINNSKVTLTNSSLGYIGTKPPYDNTNGILVGSGQLILDNTTFMNLDMGIYSYSPEYPVLEFKNTDARNFVNVRDYWFPSAWHEDPLIWATSVLP